MPCAGRQLRATVQHRSDRRFLLGGVGTRIVDHLAIAKLQLECCRQNTVPMLVDLLRKHRGARLATARRFIYTEFASIDVSDGLMSLPEDKELIRDLSCYYDNLGALVIHDFVDIDIVAGYIGSSVVSIWEKLAR